DLRRRGRRPYVIPRGGASPVGSVGYVAAVLELEEQRIARRVAIDHLVCAAGSCGTLAGLVVGASWLQAPYRIWGISVSRPRAECLAGIESLAGATAARLDLVPTTPVQAPVLLDNYVAPGYGLPSAEAVEAIRLVARTEGIFLDPVYTGKAMAGLIDLVRRGHIGRDETVLFLHTGGAPGLFAHAVEFSGGEEPQPTTNM
ncbi:MAG TPA: D-cysteine desulfhydrase family protein, partial [Chloroflexi bacterium]|nr:D-cysteine desulfhydrase family protein [Chloroflexota bacterium]